MRLIVTGISGLDKMEYLKEISQLSESNLKSIENSYGICLDPNILKEAKIEKGDILDLEDETCKEGELKSPTYLDKPKKDLLRYKNDAFDKIIKKFKEKENVILSLHAVYNRNKSLFHVLDWEKLWAFKPDMFINLIDNFYRVRATTKKRVDEGRLDPSEYLSLKDIIIWREAEIMATEMMANNIYEITNGKFRKKKVPCYLVAKEHGFPLIYQLMFESDKTLGENNGKKIVYASFPITRAKDKETLKKEAENFRNSLKKYFIVFDPYTITEKLLHEEFKKNMLEDNPTDTIEIEGYSFNIWEIFPIIDDINAHIISRDYRLIDSCEMLIAYRPALSIGANREISYAHKTGQVEVHIIHPFEDEAIGGPWITQERTKRHFSINEFIDKFEGKILKQGKEGYVAKNWR